MHGDGLAFCGAGLAVLVSGAAWAALHRRPGFYDHEVYGNSPRFHRRVLIGSALAFCGLLAEALVDRVAGSVVTAVVGLEVLGAVLYLSSFARGASDQD